MGDAPADLPRQEGGDLGSSSCEPENGYDISVHDVDTGGALLRSSVTGVQRQACQYDNDVCSVHCEPVTSRSPTGRSDYISRTSRLVLVSVWTRNCVGSTRQKAWRVIPAAAFSTADADDRRAGWSCVSFVALDSHYAGACQGLRH